MSDTHAAETDREPTFDDSGLTAEELAQFNAMAADTAPSNLGADLSTPDVPAGAPAAPALAADAAPGTPAVSAPAVTAGDDEDDGTNIVDGGDGKPAPKRVAYSKHLRILEEERNQRSQLQQQLQQQLTERAKLEERVALIAEALQTPRQPAGQPAQQDPMPDPNEDVVAFAQWQARQNARLMERLDQLSQGHQQTIEQQQAQRQEQEMVGAYRNDVVHFAGENPDFGFAYNFLMGTRLKELEAYGIADPEERKRMVRDEERELVKLALGSRQSAAARIYNIAKLRGYDPAKHAQPAQAAAPAGAPAAAAAAAPALPGSLAAPAGAPAAAAATPAATPAAVVSPAAPAAPAPAASVADEVARIREAIRSNTTLSGGNGAPPLQITPQSLLHLSDEEFGALMDRLPASRQMSILGN